MADNRKSIKEWAADDRPREKMLSKGKKALSDAELIAILLGSGSNDKSAVELAREMLSDNHGSLAMLSRLNTKELMRYKGVGEAKAVCITAALELGNRRYISQFLELPKINNSEDAYKLFRAHLGSHNEESFMTIFTNTNNNVIKVEQISGISGISLVAIDIRTIFKKALLNNATGIIIGHNHPSDNLKPSEDDKKLTRRIKEASETMSLNLLDHIIIGTNDYYSFAENGIL